MATIAKNFRVKNGLIVEGTTATVNGNNILTSGDTTDNITEGSSNLYFTDERVQDAVNALISAGTHANITITYNDEENSLSFSAENGVADSTTDDLVEGTTNLYYTDERVQDAVDALIAAGTHSNITITYNDENNSLSFAAENGVADSTTDDLAEGEINLYFTEQRARDSVSAGDGLTYDSNTGEFAASLGDGLGIAYDSVDIEVVTGNGLKIGTGGDVQIDTSITVDVDSAQALSNKSLATDLDADDNKVINLDSPTEGHHAANKTYVDEVAQGLKVRGTVEAATTADLGGTYSNGTNGVDATITIPATATLTIDGWTTWSQYDGILVKDQTNAEENGRYFVDVVGDAETAWVLKRCVHCDTAEEIPGSFVFVAHGTTYESTGWVATVDDLDTFAVGTDDINWVQFSGAGTYTAGNGLDLDGTQFSIDTAVTVDVDTAQTLTNKSIDGEDNTLTNIANESLVNDSITINSYETALGASVTLDTDDVGEGETNLYFTDERAQDAIADAIAAGTHENITITYDDATNKFTFVAENGVDDSTTDDLDEGTNNLYFTDERAQDAIADAIAAGTHSNITITYDDATNKFTFEAENGVDDSTTDDLDEGTSNLYFTDQRAVDALQAVTPTFTEIDVNSIALNVASTVTVAVQNTTGTVYSFDSGAYTSAKFFVKADTGTHTEVTEILLTLDSSSNIAITEYAIVNTGGVLANITAVMNNTDVELQATVVNDNTVVSAYGTLIV
jgi:hypothetical protein